MAGKSKTDSKIKAELARIQEQLQKVETQLAVLTTDYESRKASLEQGRAMLQAARDVLLKIQEKSPRRPWTGTVDQLPIQSAKPASEIPPTEKPTKRRPGRPKKVKAAPEENNLPPIDDTTKRVATTFDAEPNWHCNDCRQDFPKPDKIAGQNRCPNPKCTSLDIDETTPQR